MQRILVSFPRLVVSRAAVPVRGFAVSAASYLAPARKAAPARKTATTGRAKPATKAATPKRTKAAARKKAKAVKPKKAPAPKKSKAKKAPTKKELLEAKLNSNRALIKAPTKPPSSYALFVKSVAVPLIEGQPASIAERSRLYAEKWRQTGEAEKQRLQDKVVALRAEYEEAARKWWQSADPELVALENRRRKRQRGDKARLLKNPFAPKRPISAYVAFAKEHAQLNKGAADGGIGGMAKVMSAGAAKWKAMSAAAKEPYAQQAATDKIRYEQEVIKYYGRAM